MGFFVSEELRWRAGSAAQEEDSFAPRFLARHHLASIHNSSVNADKVAYYFLAALGRLAPYFERRWVRLATPAVSRVPRTMW